MARYVLEAEKATYSEVTNTQNTRTVPEVIQPV